MKAMRVNGWGEPVQLENLTQPKPASDEVLVRVRAASINPFDSFVHNGYLQSMFSIPLTLGTDFAGDVVEAGEEITHVKPGDAVFGMAAMHPGSFAEYRVAKANEVTRKPATLDYVQAAAAPLSSLAAYQTLFDLGQAQPGERILIIGAGGAVGGCAVQMAKELGAAVYAVDIPEKAAFTQGLGADRFINAREERYEDLAGRTDLVLDYVGGENFQRALSVLPDGGRYVTSLFLPETHEEADRRGIRLSALATQSRADQLDEIASRIDSGRLKIFVNRTFPLEEAQTALNFRMQAIEPGKVVLIVDQG